MVGIKILRMPDDPRLRRPDSVDIGDVNMLLGVDLVLSYSPVTATKILEWGHGKRSLVVADDGNWLRGGRENISGEEGVQRRRESAYLAATETFNVGSELGSTVENDRKLDRVEESGEPLVVFCKDVQSGMVSLRSSRCPVR